MRLFAVRGVVAEHSVQILAIGRLLTDARPGDNFVFACTCRRTPRADFDASAQSSVTAARNLTLINHPRRSTAKTNVRQRFPVFCAADYLLLVIYPLDFENPILDDVGPQPKLC